MTSNNGLFNEPDGAGQMTLADRETLLQIAKKRERLAKTSAKERAERLKADFERELDTRYHYDENEVWSAATRLAEAAVNDANMKIVEECQRLGIPTQFAPSICMQWYGRGRNAMKEERAEMRRVAYREIDALEKSARTAIERQSLDTQERIMVSGLTSSEARQFLEAMPSADALMPALSVDHVRALLANKRDTE